MTLLEERQLQKNNVGDHSPLDTPGAFESENPRSLINIAPTGLREMIADLPINYLTLSERSLYNLAKPDPMLNRLRIAFWKEFENAQASVSDMNWVGITKMIQRPSIMIRKLLEDQHKLAWVLCPPVSYDVFLQEALSHGMDRIREILDLPLRNDEGKVDAKVAELILKAAAFLDLRRHGGFVQKSVNMDIGVGMSERQARNFGEKVTIEDISHKIKQLEQELGMEKEQAGVIDVTNK